MCGIFGIITKNESINLKELSVLIEHSEQRGKDSSGIIFFNDGVYRVKKADYSIAKLAKNTKLNDTQIVLGHSRLITNGSADNQPIIRGKLAVMHNGIIVNDEEVWQRTKFTRNLEIDTEIIAAIAEDFVDQGNADLTLLPSKIFEQCTGVIASAILFSELGKILLFSNNGSLYFGSRGGSLYFASERYPLSLLNCEYIQQIKDPVVIDAAQSSQPFVVENTTVRVQNLIPRLILQSAEEKLLVYPAPPAHRCSKCVLPATMPFIKFNTAGVCNYCENYKKRNAPKPTELLFSLVEPYRRPGNQLDCIVPFSGGRDSCYSLHLIVKELKMKPVTYTYDWGMVTDLGRRNISRMCGELGVENIIIADDIEKKRHNIAMNVKAWLKDPNLGMVSIFTAGDKHFFKHVETTKKQTGIDLNLWGINPLEVTHFKTGFLGIEPDFESNTVYTNGALKQLRYQAHRVSAMLRSLGYFNSSLWDTVSGEYYRSFTKKSDYYHVFDYWLWDEKTVDDTLALYDWEKAPDTNTTWRIGDGTAAFYNYIYYTVAGFTEHDTFRSNQIREGHLKREEALALVLDENRPRYPNLKWYLDAIGLDFCDTVKAINAIPRLY